MAIDTDRHETYSIADARAQLADILGRVSFADERIVLTKHGKAIAAIIPIEDLEFLEELEAENDRRAVDAVEAEPTVTLKSAIKGITSKSKRAAAG